MSWEIAIMWWCASNEEGHTTKITSSDGKKKYDVVVGHSFRECNCPSFKFRKICKHVTQASKEACFWNQQIEGGEPIEKNGEHFCPKCGNRVRRVRVAV